MGRLKAELQGGKRHEPYQAAPLGKYACKNLDLTKIITTFVAIFLTKRLYRQMSMNLPDFMSYSNKFTNSDFVEKISRIAKRAGAKLVYAALVLYYTLQSDKISVKDKAIIIGALGYLISPLDVIPDAIPIAGLGDDLAVLVYVLNKVWGNISDEVKDKAKAKLSKWFDEDEIAEIDTLFDKDKQ